MMNNGKEKNPIIVKIGQRIQRYRVAQNLTQEQVAEAAGISQKHLSRIEQGYHNPRFDLLIELAKALNVTTDALAKDVLEDDVDFFLAGIRDDIEKMGTRAREYLRKNIKLLAESDLL